jgi:hypothetical protein
VVNSAPGREGLGPMVTLKSFIIQAVRRFLAKRGYAIVQLDEGVPESLEAYVAALGRQPVRIARICIRDSDPEPVRVFLNHFHERVVSYRSAPNKGDPELPGGGNEPLLLAIDAGELRGAGPAGLALCLARSSLVIIRSKFGAFWSGREDALDLAEQMEEAGFRLTEVLHRPVAGLSRPPEENVYLAFARERTDSASGGAAPRPLSARSALTLNQLSAPIAAAEGAVRLAGRGTGGFPAGVCNPGALEGTGGLVLLARGERIPWPIQKRSWTGFAASCQPLLLVLGEDLQIATAAEVRFDDSTVPPCSRLEDFRLFQHSDQIYTNHSVIAGEGPPGSEAPVVPEALRTAVGISRFDPEERCLTYLGAPVLDCPVARIEKNWAMFSTAAGLQLIYSFNPYRLFSAPAMPGLRFNSVIEQALRLPIPDDGLTLRNSINPVLYDAVHLLHLVHKVYPNKQYLYWAVLIDRTTLLPVKISARPLLRGIASSGASILYACSAIVRAEEVLVFGGVDDCAIGAWRISRAVLDRHWLPLP